MLQKELLKLKLMIDGELYAITDSQSSKLMWFVDSYDLVHPFCIIRIPVFHQGQHTTLMTHCVKMAKDSYSVLVVILFIGDVPAHI